MGLRRALSVAWAMFSLVIYNARRRRVDRLLARELDRLDVIDRVLILTGDGSPRIRRQWRMQRRSLDRMRAHGQQ